jgi:hypothetical protein
MVYFQNEFRWSFFRHNLKMQGPKKMPEKISIKKKNVVFSRFVCKIGSTWDRVSQLVTPPPTWCCPPNFWRTSWRYVLLEEMALVHWKHSAYFMQRDVSMNKFTKASMQSLLSFSLRFRSKCKGKFCPRTGHEVQRRSTGIALLFP